MQLKAISESQKLYQKPKDIFNQNIKSCNSSTQETTSKTSFNENDKTNIFIFRPFINNLAPDFKDNFELLEYMNSGSVGVVYKGLYKKTKKNVAIKFMINQKQKYKKEGKEKENEFLKNENLNYSQEIALSRKLHHKNTIEIYAYYKNPNIEYSVLEFAKHGDIEYFLKYLLKRNVLSETALNYFGKQILESLNYLHRCKIVHLDIKPGNILIDSNLIIKIIDFSVSCSYASFHPEDLVKFPFVGTGKFICPEIIDKTHMKIKEAEKIDIYSFGVTLFYLFYGEYPYKLKDVKSKDYNSILNHIKNENLIFPTGRKISNKFKDFLQKSLEKDYTKRLNIKEALNHPWMKGSQIIFDEKENTSCLENFLIQIITDNIKKFNDYIK